MPAGMGSGRSQPRVFQPMWGIDSPAASGRPAKAKWITFPPRTPTPAYSPSSSPPAQVRHGVGDRPDARQDDLLGGQDAGGVADDAGLPADAFDGLGHAAKVA